MLLNGLGGGNLDVDLDVSSSVMLCSMPIMSCGGRSAMLLDEKVVPLTLVEFVVQLLLLAMLVVVVKGSLCSMLSSSRRCHLYLVLSDAALDVLVGCQGIT